MRRKTIAFATLCALSRPPLLALQVINTTPANNQANLVTATGQTFTTPALGGDNQLVSITVRGPQTTPSATALTLKVWTDTDQDFATWDPGALVATSTNTIALGTVNGDHVFLFGSEVLSANTVYAFSFNNGTTEHVGVRPGLTNATGIGNGALFSAGVQPFGGAFDMSFILTTDNGLEPKDVIWTGGTDGSWDVATANWKLPDTTPALFATGDAVTFDDNAGTGNVTLAGVIEPGSIAVINDSLPYTLGGAALGGTAALVKDGPGTLALAGANTTTGGTTLNGGGIVAGDGATSGEIGLGPVTLAAGSSLTISRGDFLDYKAVSKMRDVSGEGTIFLDGGGTLFNYPGGALAFSSPGSWSGFSGNLIVKGGSELQTIRNGANAMGTGTVILGDATTSGSLSQIEGNWTWTNDISAAGPDNRIVNRSLTSGPRTLKIQGSVSGAGNLTFEDATGAMTDPNRGFVLTGDCTVTGNLTVSTAVPLRVGGVPGDVSVDGTGLHADAFGSLGTTAVNNEGTLTFSRTDTHTVSAPISGSGAVRIGIPSAANLGDTSGQVVTFPATQSYTGPTTVESGTLLVDGSLPGSLVTVAAEGTVGGTGSFGNFVSVFGNLAPGNPVGTTTFTGGTAFETGSSYVWEISDWNGAAGSGYDTIVTDELFLSGTVGEPVTIVVTPSALANFTESAATFTLAATTLGIVDFTGDNVVVDASGFPGTGTWSVAVNGNNLELGYTAGTGSSYDGFENANGIAGAGADTDSDDDGIPNGIEFVIGGDPSGPQSDSNALLPTHVADATYLDFTFRRDSASAGFNPGVEYGSSLAGWTLAENGTNGVIVETTPDGFAAGVDQVVVKIPRTLAVDGKLFARLTVTIP